VVLCFLDCINIEFFLEDDSDKSNLYCAYSIQNNKGQNIIYNKDVFLMFFQPIKIKDNKNAKTK
jgi:hypothetical protein